MTTSKLSQPSLRVHNIVEYIKYSGDFLCDADELEERGIQEILQEDFDIYETFKNEDLQELEDELQAMALQNEIREAKRLIDKLKPEDDGNDLLQSNPDNIYGKRTTYPVYYSYPVDENLRKLPKISYPLKPATQKEVRRLSGLNKLMTGQMKVEYKLRQVIKPTIEKHL
jgi:hypothetical protein